MAPKLTQELVRKQGECNSFLIHSVIFLISSFRFTKLDYYVAQYPHENPFEFQVVIKNTKSGELFCKALYAVILGENSMRFYD